MSKKTVIPSAHHATLPAQRAGNTAFFQPKLTINQPNDQYEQEADAVADRVMRMRSNDQDQPKFFKPAPPVISRMCDHCKKEKEEKEVHRKEGNTDTRAALSAENYLDSLSGGTALSRKEKDFFAQRMGHDFSDVRLHTDSDADRSAKDVNALAYTHNNHIVFRKDQYQPDTEQGKRLLAHELTHVVQQASFAKKTVQRAVHSGDDWAGHYAFDDSACTMNYRQDWYFQFPSSMNAGQQAAYMTAAENQVESVWSHKHRLIPEGSTCSCHPGGVDVSVDLVTHNEARDGRHGYGVNVVTTPTTGLTTLPTRTMTLSDTHDVAVDMGSGLTQQRIAHEFGHTLNMNDEYTGWASFWGIPGHGDRSSIMHSGDQVSPRHYQPFADMVSTALEGCIYRPAGLTSSSLVNPVARFGIGGALTLDNAEFILDLSVDRRIGNMDLLGLFTPRLGFNMLFNAANGNFMAGPTLGFSLNRFQHPIYLDIRTGILIDPEDPGRPASLNIAPSITAGFRGSGFTAGINYTGLIDVLGNNGYTNMIGVNLQFDLPGGRR